MMLPFQATIIPAFRSPAVAVPRSLIDAARIDGLAEWRIPARRALRLHRISYG
jgi:ABC-type glycerol-3-phosphate transport system permease component